MSTPTPKTITIKYDGVEYVLEYTAASVRYMQQRGFSLEDIDNKAMIQLPMLFEGAFRAHHRHVKPEKIEEIREHIPKRAELFEKLVEMYMEPISQLMDEPEEDEGNASWDTSW